MKKLNYNTKKAQRYISLYENSRTHFLSDAYKNGGSTTKNRAELQIIENMNRAKGHGYRILTHSDMIFTTGWKTHDDKYLVVDTPSYTYYIELPF